MKKFLISILLFFSFIGFAKPKVGVTMLPYYSFVANIVGDKMDVVPLVPQGVNAHVYQATAQDVKRLKGIDYVVVNGIGHDEFVFDMLKAVHFDMSHVIYANKHTPLMDAQGERGYHRVNSHTFIAVSAAISQINEIADDLSKFDPANAMYYKRNAIKYTAKIRKMKARALAKVIGKTKGLRVAATHAGYDYLLSEFGLSVDAVVEPSVSEAPSAQDLKYTIDKIKKDHIDIFFDNELSTHKNAEIIHKETGIYVGVLSHMTSGPYTKDAYEKYIQKNLDYIVKAILAVRK